MKVGFSSLIGPFGPGNCEKPKDVRFIRSRPVEALPSSVARLACDMTASRACCSEARAASRSRLPTSAWRTVWSISGEPNSDHQSPAMRWPIWTPGAAVSPAWA